MPIYYPDILDDAYEPSTFTYSEKDAMLYALGIGMGRDPLDQKELAFVTEKALKVVPTAVTVLASTGRAGMRFVPPPGKPNHRQSQLNYAMILHGEQKVELHRPLPRSGTFTSRGGVVGAFDKGPDKGGVIVQEGTWTDEAGETLVTSTTVLVARGDGGFGGPSEGAPEPHTVPERAPDISIDMETRPDQALLYRLNGDRNPLHSDPETAKSVGFPRPILHGLCTFGITCHAVLKAILDYDSDAIRSHQARFSAPVLPGDVVTVNMWQDGKTISFEALVKARNATVIRNGKTVLR